MDVGGNVLDASRLLCQSYRRKYKLNRFKSPASLHAVYPRHTRLTHRMTILRSNVTAETISLTSIASRRLRRFLLPKRRHITVAAGRTPLPLQSTLSTSQRGLTLPSLPIEALLALVLSINIRILLGNGADALLKVAVQKAITFCAALFFASLLHYLEDQYPPFVIIEQVNDVRTMAGIVSGWFGQVAGESVGYRLEVRIGEWMAKRQSGSDKSINPQDDGFHTAVVPSEIGRLN